MNDSSSILKDSESDIDAPIIHSDINNKLQEENPALEIQNSTLKNQFNQALG